MKKNFKRLLAVGLCLSMVMMSGCGAAEKKEPAKEGKEESGSGM